MFKISKFIKKTWLVPLVICLFFLVIHLWRLTLLPVFADEAIYIRWAQLMIDDWRQYLFFPLNDGKGPLFFWLLVPWQFIFADQLFAGRFLAVLIGLVQILSLKALSKTLGAKPWVQWLTMLFGSILPFWFFHHRLALTDSLLTLTLTWTTIATLQLIKAKPGKKFKWLLLAGLSLGAGLWTKLPAVLFIPIIFILGIFGGTKKKNNLLNLLWAGLVVLFGGLIFSSLKLHPAFSQLFGRGSDFLFPWQKVVFEEAWRETVINLPNYLHYFGRYFTWPILIFSLLGLVLPPHKIRRQQWLLWLSTILFAGPIAILGRVVYPRYFMPISVFVTVSAGLSFQQLWQLINLAQIKKWLRTIIAVLMFIAFSWTVFKAAQFIYAAWTNPAKLPLVSADQEQYLYKWSAGYGVKPSVEYIQQLAQNQSVAVATEGSFGTLPDGALLYFHRTNVDNIYLEGVGYPVKGLTKKFLERAQDFDRVFLLVNSHRLDLDLPLERLTKEYCRPAQAPCLQLWEITGLTDQLPVVEL